MNRKYVVYEIWTRSTVVEARSVSDAYTKSEPEPVEGMSLANWHVAALQSIDQKTGGLNYRQIPEEEADPRD